MCVCMCVCVCACVIPVNIFPHTGAFTPTTRSTASTTVAAAPALAEVARVLAPSRKHTHEAGAAHDIPPDFRAMAPTSPMEGPTDEPKASESP